MSTETTIKCPVPPITDQLGRETTTQPSPVHFKWGDKKVGIPRQLMHQMHRYDFSYPTGSYAGKMFLQGERLVWIRHDSLDPEKLVYAYIEYEETGEYDPNPHLEPCPLCKGEAYCGFEAKHSGDLVKFHITCLECDLTFGNLFKIGLELSIANSVLILEQWNKRDGEDTTIDDPKEDRFVVWNALAHLRIKTDGLQDFEIAALKRLCGMEVNRG